MSGVFQAPHFWNPLSLNKGNAKPFSCNSKATHQHARPVSNRANPMPTARSIPVPHPLATITLTEARPLPVLLLLDSSGSMKDDGKIEALNSAVQQMLGTFAAEEAGRASIEVGALAFGKTVQVHLAFQPAKSALGNWHPLTAAGQTPMGSVFAKCTEMLEDRSLVPSRSYRPTLVLVSDGQPTDQWVEPLASLLKSPRASKALRFAMAIGSAADHAMLAKFVDNPQYPVFRTHDAREIQKFFRWVSMSVTARSRSTVPNQATPLAIEEIEEFRY
jgi:uncharacterized protein YegL